MIEIGMTESVTRTCTGIVPVFSAKFLNNEDKDTMSIKGALKQFSRSIKFTSVIYIIK